MADANAWMNSVSDADMNDAVQKFNAPAASTTQTSLPVQAKDTEVPGTQPPKNLASDIRVEKPSDDHKETLKGLEKAQQALGYLGGAQETSMPGGSSGTGLVKTALGIIATVYGGGAGAGMLVGALDGKDSTKEKA